MTSDKHHLLICTVGGTPEPIAAAIQHWHPVRVIFVHSQATKITVGAVTKDCDLLQLGAWDTVELHDVEDFKECAREMKKLDEHVSYWNQRGADYDVIVDFTGGTKCMSAALAIVSRRWFCKFSYIGGTERTKGGTGIVVSGKEQMLFTQNPWDALGYQAIEDACLLFDQYAFEPATGVLEKACRASNDEAVKRSLSTFHQLCEGYGLWDRFQHKDAMQRIAMALKNAADLQQNLGARANHIIRTIKEHQRIFEQLVSQPLSRVLVADLLANARRRKQEGRFDDGVARLYRAIEAFAQLTLAEDHGISDTGNVPLDRMPEPLCARWEDHAEDGKLVLGLKDAFTLLDELGNEAGKTFKALGLHDFQRSPLMARNQSILAHGFQTVRKEVFEQIWSAAIKLGNFKEDELPTFPKLADSEGASI